MATATKKTGLSDFEQRKVLQATIAVTNAGDGLSQKMTIDPEEMHIGETRYLLIEATVAKVHYAEIKDIDGLNRVHTLKAGTATIVSEDIAHEHIEAQRVAIEKAAGIERLEFEEGDEEGDD